MRRPKITRFDDYLCSRCDLLRDELGGEVDHLRLLNAAGAEDTVVLEARLVFPDQLELSVFEVVQKTDEGGAHRLRFRYQARWRERLLLRYERDPILHPELPEHKHYVEGERIPSKPPKLHDVAEEMWRLYEQQRERVVAAAAEGPTAAEGQRETA